MEYSIKPKRLGERRIIHYPQKRIIGLYVIEVKKEIPVCEKYNLTIEEASAYFNIGKDRMREIVNENRNELVLVIGRKNLIKRKKMEEYLDRTMVL